VKRIADGITIPRLDTADVLLRAIGYKLVIVATGNK
jgi:hypothetical protein